MGISKVIVNGVTKVDLTSDTVASNNLLASNTAHNKAGNSITGNMATKTENDITVVNQTVYIPAGAYTSQVNKSVASGSARTPATTITSNPSISVSSSGLITASNSKTQSVTPTVTAGYVSSGTAGTITVSGSNTQQLTTKAAATYTPGTTAQTIASGQYLTGAQTISGDANLVAANIADGVSIFGVTGTHAGGSPEEKYLNFYDYDGTLLYSYSYSEACNLSALPPNPSHSGLVSDGWNWPLAAIRAAASNYFYSVIDVGQLYHTSSGNTTISLRYMGHLGINYYLQLYFDGPTTASVYTNDGSGTYEYVTGSNEYVTIGPFMGMSDDTELTIEVNNGGLITFEHNDTHSILRVDRNLDGWENNIVTLDAIYDIKIGNNAAIGPYGLCHLRNLETIVLPNGSSQFIYAGLGAHAFEGCTKLKHVNLPAIFMNSHCFNGCKKLRVATFAWDEDFEELAEYFFLDSGLVHTSLPYSVFMIDEYAFKNTNLQRLGLSIHGGPSSNSVEILDHAFYNCIYYDGIMCNFDHDPFGREAGFGATNAISIDAYAYFGCLSLKNAYFGEYISYIGDYAFSGSGIITFMWDSWSFDAAMNKIPTGCCKNCDNLTYVVLPESIHEIWDEAFANCTSLCWVQFNSAVPPIVYNSNAFANLPTYCEIYVPEGSLSAYTSATNYPSSSTYTYLEM